MDSQHPEPKRSQDPADIEAYLADIEAAEADAQPATPATEERFRVVMAVTLPANLDADFVWQAVTDAIEAYGGSIGDFECEPV